MKHTSKSKKSVLDVLGRYALLIERRKVLFFEAYVNAFLKKVEKK